MLLKARWSRALPLVCGAALLMTAASGRAGPPGLGAGPQDGQPPVRDLGSDSRGYPYYPGYRFYPAYPLYRAYPDYNGYPYYPGYNAIAAQQPGDPFWNECLGLRPALWRFPDYFSGNYPIYYADSSPDFRGIPPVPPPPLPPPPPGVRGSVSVKVPDGAEVWFDGRKTTASGAVRRFTTPPLTPGNRYCYDVRARWEENGCLVERTAQVFVTAGSAVDVLFPSQPLAVVAEK